MSRRGGLSALCAAAVLLGPGRAAAWDPSTTHLGMVDRAAVRSGLHVQWMDASNLQRGLFSSLRLDPDRLTVEQRRRVTLGFRRAHAASGALGLGGPGACPGPSAPASTRARCVEGDLWEMTALGWIRLGVLLEIEPRVRLLHHFVDLEEPLSPTWSDRRMPNPALRALALRNGGPLASTLTGTGFKGRAPSAVVRIEDPEDPWSLAVTREHLHKALSSASRADREHHLALGLIGVGALLHVVQDLSLPAHARGDVSAFFAPLSGTPGDRGLPLQEFARQAYGRGHLPEPLSIAPREADEAGRVPPRLARDVREHLVGNASWEGLIHYTGRRFFSETTMPEPRAIDPETTPEQAAAALLGDDPKIDPVELAGAKLVPWPAEAGYLVTGPDRVLAAFDMDEQGRIRPYLDRRVFRSQANLLIPKAVEVSASLLGILFPTFPVSSYDADANVLEIDLTNGLQEPVMTAFVEDAEGKRRVLQRIRLRPGERNRIAELVPPELPADARVVVMLEGRAPDGAMMVSERALSLGTPATPETGVPVPRPSRPVREQPAEPPKETPAAPTREVPGGVTPTRPPGEPPGAAEAASPTEETPEQGATQETPEQGATQETPEQGATQEAPRDAAEKTSPERAAGDETPSGVPTRQAPPGEGPTAPDLADGAEAS